MSIKTKISLKNFFVFNPTFCSEEGDDGKKILFFYPEIEENEKLKDVGFVEALIKFTGSFSLDSPTSIDVLTMRTKKTLKLFFEPEPLFWVVLTVNVPFERKEKDKKEYIEYYSDDAHESVFKRIVQRSYMHFRLFSGTFQSNMVGEEFEEKLQTLQNRLNNFYMKYLLTINLNNADIVDSIECIQFKPVTNLIFFRIINFLNMLMSIKNLKIKKCIFLYNQEVIYSSLNPMNLFVINEYLNESLFPKFIQRRNNQSVDADRSVGCFVTELETDTIASAPRVYLQKNDRGELKPYRMLVYTILDISLVLFIDDNKPIGDEFQNEIKYSVGPQLSLISKDISANSLHFQQQNASKAEETVHEKYIYFNHKNNRFHACLYDSEGTMSHREGRKTEFSSSVMNILCDLYAKEEEKTDSGALISSEKETIVKTFNDYWLVNRTFNNRSLYLILHKSSTLIDVAEESQRLISEIVKNVYFSNQQ